MLHYSSRMNEKHLPKKHSFVLQVTQNCVFFGQVLWTHVWWKPIEQFKVYGGLKYKIKKNFLLEEQKKNTKIDPVNQVL